MIVLIISAIRNVFIIAALMVLACEEHLALFVKFRCKLAHFLAIVIHNLSKYLLPIKIATLVCAEILSFV